MAKMYKHTHTHTCAHTHTHVHAHTHVHTLMYAHTHTDIKAPSNPIQYQGYSTHTHIPVFSSRNGESCHRAAIVCPGHHDASYGVSSLKVHQVSCSTHTGRLERKIGQWVYTIINYTRA